MGIGRGTEGAGAPTAKSIREKISDAASSLIKFGNDVIGNIKAIFSEMKAKDDKVVVDPPGLRQKEVDNKTVQGLVKDQVKLSDIAKIGGLTLLSLMINNPLPLMFAQKHAKNLAARIKAKEKELAKIKRQAAKGKTKVAKRKLAKNAQDQRALDALSKKQAAYADRLNVVQKGVAVRPATRDLNPSQKARVTAAGKELRKLGFSASEIKSAINTAVKHTSANDFENLVNSAIREASNLRRNA